MSTRLASHLRDRAVQVVFLSALAVASITISCGLFLEFSTRNLVSATKWVEHTQEVLSTLTTAFQQLETIDKGTKIFSINGNEEALGNAQRGALRLVDAVYNVGNQVIDNARQTNNVSALQTCSTFLQKSVREQGRLRSAQETDAILDCRQTIGLMVEQERQLLRDRGEAAQQRAYSALLIEGLFVTLTLGAMLLLFFALLRSVLNRKTLIEELAKTNEQLQAAIVVLNENSGEATVLMQLRNELTLCVTIEEICAVTGLFLRRLTGCSEGAIVTLAEGYKCVRPRFAWGRTPVMNTGYTIDKCCAVRSGQGRWRSDSSPQLQCVHFVDTPTSDYLCLPLVAHGDTVGVLHLVCGTSEETRALSMKLSAVNQAAQFAAIAMAGVRLTERLEARSLPDAMRGMFYRKNGEFALIQADTLT